VSIDGSLSHDQSSAMKASQAASQAGDDKRGPASPVHAAARGTAARIGLLLCLIYMVLYAGFVAIVLFRPDLLASRPFGGVNLAIAYGMGLIASALVLGLVYMVACWLVDRRTVDGRAAQKTVLPGRK